MHVCVSVSCACVKAHVHVCVCEKDSFVGESSGNYVCVYLCACVYVCMCVRKRALCVRGRRGERGKRPKKTKKISVLLSTKTKTKNLVSVGR